MKLKNMAVTERLNLKKEFKHECGIILTALVVFLKVISEKPSK